MQPANRQRRLSALKSAAILFIAIGGTIAFAVIFYGYMIPDTGDTVLSGNGVIAMILGVVFSLVVGIGLMALVFFSHHRGYDEDVARRDDIRPR